MTSTVELNKLGDLVAKVGSPEFGPVFYRVFQELFSIDECAVFCFPKGEKPHHIVVQSVSTETRREALILADSWVAGDFRHDPYLGRYQPTKAQQAYVLRPMDLHNVDFRHRYYEGPGIDQELGLIGEVDGTKYLISLFRKSAGVIFRNEDLKSFEEISGLVLKAIHRHNMLDRESLLHGVHRAALDLNSPECRDRALEQLKDLLLGGTDRLSVREAEVCSRIALGYSTLAISLHFGISLNTVATHRKRAYSKLKISSQNELFSRYLYLFGSIQSMAA